MKRLLFIIGTFCILFATSCQESIEQVSAVESQTTSIVKYQIDGQEVTKSDFFKQLLPRDQASFRSETTDMTTIANAYRVLGESQRVINKQTYDIINVFTSDNEYYAYADANGHLNERFYDQIVNHLADYAETSGAAAALESTGVVPQSYIRYMDDYLVKNGFEPSSATDASKASSRALFTQIYQDCSRQGTSFPILTKAWLGSIGFNNNISSYVPVTLFGRCEIFDRAFFFRRITGIWNNGSNTINFCKFPWEFVNDRASSWITL